MRLYLVQLFGSATNAGNVARIKRRANGTRHGRGSSVWRRCRVCYKATRFVAGNRNISLSATYGFRSVGLFQNVFLPIDIYQEKSTENEGQTVRFALFSIVRMQLYAKFVVIRGQNQDKTRKMGFFNAFSSLLRQKTWLKSRILSRLKRKNLNLSLFAAPKFAEYRKKS